MHTDDLPWLKENAVPPLIDSSPVEGHIRFRSLPESHSTVAGVSFRNASGEGTMQKKGARNSVMSSARRVKRTSAKDREKEAEIRSTIGRRGFFKLIGLGTLGLGFGVSDI